MTANPTSPLALPPPPNLNQDRKCGPERVSVCFCLLRCLWLSRSFMLSSQAEPDGEQTWANVKGTDNTRFGVLGLVCTLTNIQRKSFPPEMSRSHKR